MACSAEVARAHDAIGALLDDDPTVAEAARAEVLGSWHEQDRVAAAELNAAHGRGEELGRD